MATAAASPIVGPIGVLGFKRPKRGGFMARDGNTYAKKERETLKRQKAQAKRERREKRKTLPEAHDSRPADPSTNEV
jgi:hypothetical protein